MKGSVDWRATLEDPRFWACYYTAEDDIREEAFGLSYEQLEPYYLRLIGLEDLPAAVEMPELHEAVEGSIFRITITEGFTWEIELRPIGDEHTLFHPTYYPDGRLMAKISTQPAWPGLRWPELCALRDRVLEQIIKPCPDEAIVPLLFPIVGLNPDDPLPEIRAELREYWRELDVLRVGRLEYWLDHLLQSTSSPVHWQFDATCGWRATTPASPRAIGSLALAPFLTMLRVASNTRS